MMSIKNRLAKLEDKQPAEPRPTWKDFITGAWEPSPEEWRAFLERDEQTEQQENKNDVHKK